MASENEIGASVCHNSSGKEIHSTMALHLTQAAACVSHFQPKCLVLQAEVTSDKDDGVPMPTAAWMSPLSGFSFGFLIVCRS